MEGVREDAGFLTLEPEEVARSAGTGFTNEKVRYAQI